MEQNILARYITKILLLLGFSPRHYGFAYLREMIVLALVSQEKKLTNLYSIVASNNRQPIEAVQTAVRTALKTAQNQKAFEYFESLIGTKFIEPNYLLAPRDFISLMMEYLTYVWDGRENSLHF